MNFKLLKKSKETKARLGIISTAHGDIETPVFMPVGTTGTVKAMTMRDLKEIGAPIILGNTYHLYLRPGLEVIKKAGGLHKFISWDRPMLTDSGGFQVFSLKGLRKVTDEGVVFQSFLDGSEHNFTPEKVMEIENILGADIIMTFDECVPNPCEKEYAVKALERTTEWAKRCRKTHNSKDRALFGIIQGSVFPDLRARSAKEITALDFEGYAIGGLSVGENKDQMYGMIDVVEPFMPENKPRYLMGVGTPEDIWAAVERGVDMFDCVMPTRIARNGGIYTSGGRIIIRNSTYSSDFGPLDPECDCYVCKTFSKAYLRHLISSGEITAMQLNTLHNLSFMIKLLATIKTAIKEDRFLEAKEEFFNKYGTSPKDGPVKAEK